MKPRCLLLAACTVLGGVACVPDDDDTGGSSSSSSGGGSSSSVGSSSSPASSSSAAQSSSGPDVEWQNAQLAKVATYLKGDFDNRAQHEETSIKLVERHVCDVPNQGTGPAVVWLYTEHVEVTSQGRDAYYTRVNELKYSGGRMIMRVYKFVTSHQLSTNAFAFNGPRDGCLKPEVLGAITDTDLVYRTGCDLVLTPSGDNFTVASRNPGECTFPGGYINTTATIFPDGMDTQDQAFQGGDPVGDEFKFRRVPADG